jgi:hypothetical protein
VFWEMVASKLDLGRIMSAQIPAPPREGLLGGFLAALCVGGLVEVSPEMSHTPPV